MKIALYRYGYLGRHWTKIVELLPHVTLLTHTAAGEVSREEKLLLSLWSAFKTLEL